MNDITKFLAANIDLQNRTFKRQQYKKVIIRAYQNSKKVKNLHTHFTHPRPKQHTPEVGKFDFLK